MSQNYSIFSSIVSLVDIWDRGINLQDFDSSCGKPCTKYWNIFCFKAWSAWSVCEANCMRTKTRSCQGGDECAQSRSLEEPCDDGLCNQGTFSVSLIFCSQFGKIKILHRLLNFNIFLIHFLKCWCIGLFPLIIFNQILQLTFYVSYFFYPNWSTKLKGHKAQFSF